MDGRGASAADRCAALAQDQVEPTREWRVAHEGLLPLGHAVHDHAPLLPGTLGSRSAVLDGGRLLQVTPPPLEVFERPATRFVAGFIGSPPMNLLDGRGEAGCFNLGQIELPCPVGGEGPLVLGVRLRSTLPAERLHRSEADGAPVWRWARVGGGGRGAR